jgi:hypothetical protein
LHRINTPIGYEGNGVGERGAKMKGKREAARGGDESERRERREEERK